MKIREDLTVDSATLAQGCGITHESAMRLLNSHRATMEETFGLIRFEIGVKKGPQRGKMPRTAILTEDQATFFVTLCQNTKSVVKFKAGLVAAFADAKKQLGTNRRLAMIPTSSQLALMVLNRDEQLIRTRRILNLVEPDYSAYGELAPNGRSKTCLRRASFVAAPKGKRSRKNAALLVTLAEETALDNDTQALPFE